MGKLLVGAAGLGSILSDTHTENKPFLDHPRSPKEVSVSV